MLLGTRRRIRAVEPGRQSVVQVQDRGRDPPLANGERDRELQRLAVEFLLVFVERRLRGRVECLLGDEHTIDMQADAHRHRSDRPPAVQEQPHQVLPGHGHAMRRMRRVGQAQACRVVGRGHGPHRGDDGGRCLQADQRRRLRFVAEHRRAHDLLCRAHVLLEQHRRQRQHVGDVVEPIPGIVLREVIGRADVDPEEVADRVVVFSAIEAAGRDAPRIRRRDALEPRELLLDPRRDGLDVLRVGPLLVLGRHLAGPDLEQHVLDVIEVRGHEVGRLDALEVHAALLPPVVVAVGAVLLEEGLDDGVEGRAIGFAVVGRGARRRGCGQGGHSHEQQDECAPHGGPRIVDRGWPPQVAEGRGADPRPARTRRCRWRGFRK